MYKDFLVGSKGVLRCRTKLTKEQIPVGYEEVVNPKYDGPTILVKSILPCKYREIETVHSPSYNCETERWICSKDDTELVERVICNFCQRELWKQAFPTAENHNKINREEKHV